MISGIEKTIVGIFALTMGVLASVSAYIETKQRIKEWQRERRQRAWEKTDPDSSDGSFSASD